MPYDHRTIDAAWQRRWADAGAFAARDGDPREKEYLLVEFPYPSGDGLHVGHLRSYTAMDVLARKRRMEGRNVLYPIGWDAFGLPAENFAVKTGQHPRVTTERNIANFRRQLQAAGFSFDWAREVNTTDPAYYKWTQWIFLKLLEHGLAYKAKVPINWCPSCKIGLANEEAVGGRCERCGGPVEQRDKEQWMLKITAYAEKLLAGLEHVDYIERAKVQQRNWIGRSEGAEITFALRGIPGQEDGKHTVTVFTTRPDTLFGATFLVVSPELAQRWVDVGWQAPDAVRDYVANALATRDMDRLNDDRAKTGVPTGIRAVNPANNEEIPVWVADYVLGSYGTGAVMAVPAHDERDWAFAWKHELPVRQVIQAPESSYLVIEKSLPPDAIQLLSAFGMVTVEREIEDWGKFFRVRVSVGREKEFIAFLEQSLLLVANDIGGGWYADSVGTSNITVFNGAHFSVWQPDALEKYKVYGRRMHIPEKQLDISARAYVGDGVLVNTGAFDGMRSEDAKQVITEHVGGKMTVTYKLRDWVFSRQRYWGEPIPVVFCAACATPPRHSEERSDEESHAPQSREAGEIASRVRNDGAEGRMIIASSGAPHAIIPVPEDQLPVLLPEVERYQPSDTGESPLASIADWVNTSCPRCGGPAKRETDVMPNWAGSSWYFLRYCDPRNDTALADPAKLAYWMGPALRSSKSEGGVDWYNGGMEHTTLHLLYSRFWNLFLHDIGVVPMAEPYAKRTSHGMILAENGEKMSKSRGNVVNPDAIIERYGADAVRVYEMFIGPFDQAVPWSENGLVGCRRFLEKVWAVRERVSPPPAPPLEAGEGRTTDRLLHKTIKRVGEDVEAMRFNTAVAAMMEYVNDLAKRERVAFPDYVTFLALLAPFAPHLVEEIHAGLEVQDGRGGKGAEHSIFTHAWPAYDQVLTVDAEVTMAVQVNGKVRATVRVPADVGEADATARALVEPNVVRQLNGATPKKVIYVPGKLVNIVI